MKNINKIFIALSLGVTFTLASCNKNLGEINVNPNNVSTSEVVPTSYIMTNAQWNLAFNNYDHWNNLRQWGVTSQHWAQNNYTEEDRYQYRTNVIDSYYQESYEMANDFYQIYKLVTDKENGSSYSAYGSLDMQAATATIMKCFTMMHLCQTMGSVPYSEALQIDAVKTPKFDDEADIFKAVIAELTYASNTLQNTDLDGWASGDVIYSGNNAKWAKFANSLRLVYAMRMSNADPDYSAAQAQAAIDAGVFESNDDNAIFKFVSSSFPDYHPIYYGYVPSARNDFTLSRQFTDLMLGNDDACRPSYNNVFNGVVDPRHAIFVGEGNIAAGAINGQPYGMPTSDNGAYFGTAANNVVNFSPSVTPVSIVCRYDFWSTFMDYTNVVLFEAEFKNNDATLFEVGVRSSLEQWGSAASNSGAAWDSEVEAYVTAVMDKFNAASDDQKLEMIITQKYIHNFAHNDHEGWFEYSRTGYPQSMIVPGDVTANVGGTDILFTALADNANCVAKRIPYPNSEATANKVNYNSAISALEGGANTVTAKLFWQK